MTKDEALRLAWDALEDIGDEWGFTSQRTVPKRKEAITAIKKALANEALEKMAENARELGLDYEPAQEPVAVVRWNDIGHISWRTHVMLSDDTPLYTTPPQRTWVGLTDEEKSSFWTADQMTQKEWDKLFIAIEAKLKEKNT